MVSLHGCVCEERRKATRETHHTQPPFHQARSVPKHTKESVFDAWNGYHSVGLCKEDRALTTFITPWGRYRYMMAPQGCIASGTATCADSTRLRQTSRTTLKVLTIQSLVRLDHCSILPGGGMATVVRKQWNNVEPEEICIRAE